MMTKCMLAAGAAAMALAAPALAGPGGGHGGGGGGDHGGGGGNPQSQGGGKGHGGGGGGGGGLGGGFVTLGGGHGGGHGGGFAMHGGGHEGRASHMRQERHAERAARENRHAERAAMREARHHELLAEASHRGAVVRDHGRAIAVAGAATAAFPGARYAEFDGQRNPIYGCPPGLAAKDNGCMPPGQLKKQWGYGAPLRQTYADSYLPGLFRSWYPDNQQYYYRYGDGYAYRVDRTNNFVNGLFPLMGTGYYAPGEQYPAAYDVYNVPQPYQTYYPDNGAYDYRYGDGAIYQIDRSSGLVQSIVALLTGGLGGGGLGGLGGLGGGLGGPGGLGGIGSALGGLGGLGIGRQLPAGYDAYNLPDAYRDRYADTANENYRYANGNIYQVDPRSQLIQQIISAVV
ncbi:MAG: hypothetical protein ABIO85_06895 [Sphingomicrobium sp.]